MISKIGLPLIKNNYNLGFVSQNLENKSPVVESRGGLSNIYYVPFKGSSLENKLLAIEDLHCPICGVSTLSKEKFEEIKNGSYPTSRDLANVLRTNKRYVPIQLRGLVADFDQFSSRNPELPSHIAIQILRKNLEFTDNLKIMRLKEGLVKTACKSNFNEQDLKKLDNIFGVLNQFQNKKINYAACKNKVVEIMNTMENSEAQVIFKKSRDVLKSIMMENFCLSAHNAKELSPEERVNIFLSKTFTNSVRDTMYMKSKSEKYDNEPFVACAGCKNNRTSIIDPVLPANKSMQNIAKYFDDIYSSPFLDKDLQDHTIKVKYAAQMISKGAVNTTKLTSSKFEKVKNDLHNTEIKEHSFELVNEEGIPCASCGITMLTYNQKEKIRVEINNAKDIFELQEIIHKYSDYIKPLYQKAYAIFDKLLEENPNITDEEMMD
ncbi:hypothetical protein IJ425_01140, partial [bacterium]|nr:hypothetical protein [bacterium]